MPVDPTPRRRLTIVFVLLAAGIAALAPAGARAQTVFEVEVR